MEGFKTLQNVSHDFESGIRRITTELFSAKTCIPFEDVVAKKLKDLHLLTSKLRLLQAKQLACPLSVTESTKDEIAVMTNYGQEVSQKLLEQKVLKIITQNHVVFKTFATCDKDLEPEIIEKKKNILEVLRKYSEQESQLRQMESILNEKQEELLETRKTWSETLDRCFESKQAPLEKAVMNGPLYKKMETLVNKMELMRWVIAKLVTSRTGNYDWASDPHKRLGALALARQRHCVENYIEM